MAEDNRVEQRTGGVKPRDPLERRSIDPQTVIDGALAYGAATGGTGTLLIGIAKIKESLDGSGSESGSEAPAGTQSQPKDG